METRLLSCYTSPMPKEKAPLTTDQKMDLIVKHLERLDKRDRLRMIGGTIRSIIGLIPLLLLLGSIWYLYQHGDQFMKDLLKKSAKDAAGQNTLMQVYNEYMKKK